MANSKKAYKFPKFKCPKKFKMLTYEEMVDESYRRGKEIAENRKKRQEEQDLLRQEREKKERQRKEKEEQDLLKQEQDLLKQEQDPLKQEHDLLKQKQDLFKQKQEHVQLMRKKQGIRYIKSLFPKFKCTKKFKMSTYEEMVDESYRRGREMAIKRLIQQEQQDLLKQEKETPCPNSKYSGKVTKKTAALKKKK